jgi:hypothetical protein
MPWTDTAINAGLNAMLALVSHIGLADESGTELAGGSYARQAVGWDSAGSAVALLADAETIPVPAATTVAFVTGHTASSAGTQHFIFPVQGTTLTDAQKRPMLGVVNDSASTDTIKSDAHGLANTNRVVLYAENGQSIPTGLTAGTVYYVISANTDDFQVSTTSGGSAVAVTADGELFIMRCVPEAFTDAGTYSFADQAIAAAGRMI